MFLEFIKKALKKEENRMRSNFDRILPRHELLNDRWEKARALGFEKDANIYDSSYVFGNVTVGEKTWIGPYTILDGTGTLCIGSYCNISSGVQIYTHSSMNWVLTKGEAQYEYSTTHIGDCVYVGSQSIIDKGIKIGDHSIVAANSYVNKSFPPYSVLAGTPAKRIGTVHIDSKNQVTIEYNKGEL